MPIAEWHFEPRPEEVRSARGVLRAWLSAVGISQTTTSEAVLVASELVTNGLVHDGAGAITVRAKADGDDGVKLEVVTLESPAGETRDIEVRGVNGALEGGRGLGIVMALADEFAVRRKEGVRTVLCSLRSASTAT